MAHDSAEAVLSINISATQEIGFDPVSLLSQLTVHICFVGVIHCDLAKGITLGKVEGWVC